MTIDGIALLGRMSGTYTGGGMNHEGEVFVSRLTVENPIGKSGLALTYRAQVGRRVVHDERSLIGRDEIGRAALYTLTSNTPAILKHEMSESLSLQEDGTTVLVFRYGEEQDTGSFRERLTLRFNSDERSFEYVYAWGMPGHPFAERSRSKMVAEAGSAPVASH